MGSRLSDHPVRVPPTGPVLRRGVATRLVSIFPSRGGGRSISTTPKGGWSRRVVVPSDGAHLVLQHPRVARSRRRGFPAVIGRRFPPISYQRVLADRGYTVAGRIGPQGWIFSLPRGGLSKPRAKGRRSHRLGVRSGGAHPFFPQPGGVWSHRREVPMASVALVHHWVQVWAVARVS